MKNLKKLYKPNKGIIFKIKRRTETYARNIISNQMRSRAKLDAFFIVKIFNFFKYIYFSR
jgi:hypothetical protein